MSHNYSYQNLQGKSFKSEDLSNCDFSYSDIRGADFTGAILTDADFSYAQAGMKPQWEITMLILAAILSAVSGATTVFAAYEPVKFLIPRPPAQSPNIPEFICFLLLLSVNLALLFVSLRQGIQKAFSIVAGGVAIVVPAIGILAAIGTDRNQFFSWFRAFRTINFIEAASGKTDVGIAAIIVPLAISVVATLIVLATLSLAVVLGRVVAEKFEFLIMAEAMAIAVIATGIVTRNTARYFNNLPSQIGVIALATIFAGVLASLSYYNARKVLAEDENYTWFRQVAIALTVIGGTSFRNANLTEANFSHAILKSTDFTTANTTRTLWHLSKKLDWAKLSQTILEKPQIRDLLVSGDGCNKSYSNFSLRGANLIKADLSRANLKEADLSEATLEAANLENANLTQTQAIGTNFKEAKFTGACGLGTWNIDNTTNLEWVDCRYVYLLEHPKPRTDDRERRPNSGEFKPGEFTMLFQKVVETVDLIFRNGIKWTAFIQSFHQVQVQNEDIQLCVQSVENKGDGVVVVKVRVPLEADKFKIHSDFVKIYDNQLKLEERFRELEGWRQRQEIENANMKAVIQQIEATCKDRVVMLNLDYEKDCVIVKVQIWSDGHRYPVKFEGKLPDATEVVKNYQDWREVYYKNRDGSDRIKPKPAATRHSETEHKQILQELAVKFKTKFNNWLNSEIFCPTVNKLREKLNPNDEIRIIIETENLQLRRLPWNLWDFFDSYPKAEAAISRTAADRAIKLERYRTKIRILAILGSDSHLNLDADKRSLATLPNTEVVFLVKPNRAEFNKYLWDEQGWDILCYSGHSSSKWDGSDGWIEIDATEKLTIGEIEHALKAAIARGLQLAIFNSCDGLGFARELANLYVPQMIVMRELVPDIVAQEFFNNFIKNFAIGESLYVSMRQARQLLQDKDFYFPCASWLPVICQNQAEVPQKWQYLAKPLDK
ncbi:MAG TPA: low-complexity protein [Cyanobacteria bacterium UBA11372]|nr:low-complexity protein [Cyanobacteria bacterium UBA11372]